MSNEKKPTAFEQLLKSLEDEDKKAGSLAVKEDDKKVKLASEEGDDDDEEDDGEDGGKEFGKSLGANAEGDDLVDATVLIKSLMERQTSTDDTLVKAMTSMAGALGKQNNLIKSLQAEIKTLASQGRGRKTVLNVLEKPGITDVLAKSGGAGEGAITPADLLAKCDVAYSAGKLTASEFNKVDVCLRNSWPVDADVLRKVAAAT